MKLLVVYATTDGMTARIAERIGETARAAGSRADVLNAAALPKGFDPSSYDGILLGASMHVQGYQRAATRFVRHCGEALRTRPSGFFSVCLSILSTSSEERAESRRIAERFPAKLGWNPEIIEIIAGALMFSRYGVLRRMAMKAIAKKEMGSVDATRDTVFTDWEAVDRFARGFVGFVTDRTSRATSASASI
jgi:menaquinone-dependent protoporphyrinogen oxidase